MACATTPVTTGQFIQSAADRRRRSWFWAVHDTLAILRMRSRHIPPDHVDVITVPRQGPPDALWARFASVLDIEPGSIDVPSTRVNCSLGLAEAEFLRRMNEELADGMPEAQSRVDPPASSPPPGAVA